MMGGSQYVLGVKVMDFNADGLYGDKESHRIKEGIAVIRIQRATVFNNCLARKQHTTGQCNLIKH